jgi:hypothetical protein
VPEETKGYVVYLKDEKGHFYAARKYIEALEIAQNASLLAAPPSEDESSDARNGGAVTPAKKSGNLAMLSRVSRHMPDRWKPSRRLRDALASCVEAIEVIYEGDCVFNVNLGAPLTLISNVNEACESLAVRS